MARKIHTAMIQDGHTIGRLEGEMAVEERAETINAFREGKIRLLITTNVAARGTVIKFPKKKFCFLIVLIIPFELLFSINLTKNYQTDG